MSEPITSPVPSTVPVPKVETTTVPAIKVEPKGLDSTKFVELSKKEIQLVKDRDAFKKEREEFEKVRAPLMAGNDRLLKFDNLLKKDPIEAMKFAGFSETDLINFLAAGEDKSTPEEKAVRLAQEEIKKFKDEQTNEKTKLQEEQETKTITKFKDDILKFTSSQSEKYEYCNFYGDQAQELIYDTVSAVLNDSAEVISIEEATNLVENYYEEQDKLMNTLKKRNSKPTEPIKEVTQPIVEVGPTSLTSNKRTIERVPQKDSTINKISTKTFSNPQINSAYATPEENKMRIIEKFRGLR